MIYNERLVETHYTINTAYQVAFDTLWTLATVLNYTETMRVENGSKPELQKCRHLPGELVPLNEFNYPNAFMGCVMKENYHRVNFTGVSVSTIVPVFLKFEWSYGLKSS